VDAKSPQRLQLRSVSTPSATILQSVSRPNSISALAKARRIPSESMPWVRLMSSLMKIWVEIENMTDARVSGTGIVDRDLDAPRAQRGKSPQQFVVVFDAIMLGDFDNDPLGRNPSRTSVMPFVMVCAEVLIPRYMGPRLQRDR